MSHNLFGDRFGDARQPAWHSLGRVFKRAISAVKALKEIGEYEVRLAPAVADGIDLQKNAILRGPTTDDPETRFFGIVSKDYHLLTPQDICTIYDERVGKPVETIGALGYGEMFFLSTYLPTLSVKGDELENYLLISNPMTGLAASAISVTPVRTVCQNTLLAADRLATQKLKIVHDKHAAQRFGDWLQETYEMAETTAKVLRDLFVEMTAVRMKDADARRMFEAAYPMPKKPNLNAPKAVMEQRTQWWQENVLLTERRRAGAKELFEGMGTGLSEPPARGTLWGAYNAVVETEDYRRGRNNDQIAASAIGWNVLPERATIKKRAFEYAVSLVNKK